MRRGAQTSVSKTPNFILKRSFYTLIVQAGIKISRRNISNLRYADDTTLMAESEEELKSLDVWMSGTKKPGCPDVWL